MAPHQRALAMGGGGGSAGLLVAGARGAGIVLGVLIVVHYLASIPRLEWLLGR